jgi:hypothetical protein
MISSSQEPKAPRGWLLVVDDDSSVGALLVDLLEQTGFEGWATYDGPAAFFTALGAGVVAQVGVSRVFSKPFILDVSWPVRPSSKPQGCSLRAFPRVSQTKGRYEVRRLHGVSTR